MHERYVEWVKANVANPCGRCAEETARMVTAFPELRRVRGWYVCHVWGRREHWWCVDQQGSIVDPTADQFPSLGLDLYEPVDEGAPPINRCMNCGGYVYGGGPSSVACSDACADELDREYSLPVPDRRDEMPPAFTHWESE